jgi:ubiquinone/menaquinone biosynthesis C-methylase UbiE
MPPDFNVVGVPPWGRAAAEYEAFFALADVPSDARVLDCAAGPSSFAAEWGERGRSVVAVDPVYAHPAHVIAADFEPTAVRMLRGMRAAHDRFRWDHYGTPEAVVDRRRQALTSFLADIKAPRPRAAYVAARLPTLPFGNDRFDLVLCSHMLFLYSATLAIEMHIASLRELLRVGREVRIFPLLNMDGERSAHLEPSLNALFGHAIAEMVPVPFEFQRGGAMMLQLRRHA